MLLSVSMKRRDLLTGLALAAGAEAQTPAAESLYIPKPHRVEDRALLQGFMDEHAFVDLVTAVPAVRITHIPVFLDRAAGPFGTLYGHIARNNPQREALEAGKPATIVFRGPHAFISPGWYAGASPAVPTWNFAVVHAGGTLKPITEKKALYSLLGRLIAKFESRYGDGSYDFAKVPAGYIDGMIGGIVGFEMQVATLEGKFKLGQERSEADKAGMLKHLGSPMREFTAGFYARK